jgi:autotransporter-associated beta strand protein
VSTLTLGRINGAVSSTLSADFSGRGTVRLTHPDGVLQANTIDFAVNTYVPTNARSRTVFGTLDLSNGIVRATTMQPGAQTGTATPTITFNWTDGRVENTVGGDLVIDGIPVTLLAGTHVFGASGANTITLGTTSTIAGVGGFSKDGTGRLVLDGVCSHSGDTIVSNGTLVVNSAFAGPSSTYVRNGATLAGTGTLVAVTIEGGGTISPGSSIGTLTGVAIALQVGSYTVMEVDRDTPTNDVLSATAITFGGTLVISNTASALQAGDAFKLFNGSVGGSFSAIDPVTPGAGLAWDTSMLTSNGTIAVLSIAPPPTNAPITASVRTGTNWAVTVQTEAGVNYVMQSNTNLLNGAGWSNIQTNAGTGSTITNVVPLDPAKAKDFIRFITE